MATTTNVAPLKINYLTYEQYQTALANNQINDNELYFTPTNNIGTDFLIDLAVTAKDNTGRATAGADKDLYNDFLDYAAEALDTTNNRFSLKKAMHLSIIRPVIWGGRAIDDDTTVILNKVDKDSVVINFNESAASNTVEGRINANLIALGWTDCIV